MRKLSTFMARRNISSKLFFILLVCVAARPTHAFWVYGDGPNGLETDVGVEDRTYVNNRDVESTDGLPDKNEAVVNTELDTGANNWATPEENSLSDDSSVISSYEGPEGLHKKKRNNDMKSDREYNALARENYVNPDNIEGDDRRLYEQLVRRRRSSIQDDDEADTGADLQNESDNSESGNSVQVSVVRRDAEKGQNVDNKNTLNVDPGGLISKQSAVSQINKNDTTTKNATRGPRQLNSPQPASIASPPSDSQIEHDLDAANSLINKMKYSIDDDDDDDDDENTDEEAQENDSVNGASKRAVDANDCQQLDESHKENINKRTGDIDFPSRKNILDDVEDDYDDEDMALKRKRDSNFDYDDDYDTDDINIKSAIRNKRESGIYEGPGDDDDDDDDYDDNDEVLWKRDTSSMSGLDDDDDDDYDDEDRLSAIRRKRETSLDEVLDDDDDDVDEDDDDEDDDDDNNSNRRRKSLNEGLAYIEVFSNEDNADVDGRSTARQKKDTSINVGSDAGDDNDHEHYEDEDLAILRKRDTADGQRDIDKQAFAREKRSKNPGTNTNDEVLSDKENANVVSDSVAKNRKARAVFANQEVVRIPDAGTIDALHRKLKRLIKVFDSDTKKRKARAVFAYTEVDRKPDAGTTEALHRKLKRLIQVLGDGASGRIAVKPVE